MHQDKCCATELDRLTLKFQHVSLSYIQLFFVFFTPTLISPKKTESSPPIDLSFNWYTLRYTGHAVEKLLKALRYKPVARGFVSGRGH